MTAGPGHGRGGSLRLIPGIGPRMEQDLLDLGYTAVDNLRGEDPESMYRNLCKLRGVRQDRCVLYVFRCAVYFASHRVHDAELLKWWRWKDTMVIEPGPEALQARDCLPGTRKGSAGKIRT